MAAPKHAETFDETDFEAIPAAALRELSRRGTGILDGALDLAPEWVANAMTEALWSVAMSNFDPQDLPAGHDLSRLSDRELQDYAALVFHKTAQRENGCHGVFGPLGASPCVAHALAIEDWSERNHPDEAPEPE
jgi:hypothetical protein